jgi:hypothetical protein
MFQLPKTETDRLANVIHVLQLGQKTGKLIVERNDTAKFEQGLITFVNGQITQVSVNQQQGPDALNWLKSWGPCRFTFLTEQKTGPSGVLPQQASTTGAIPTAWLIAPYPTRHIDDGIRLIEQMDLSRTHRHLFLLIDGKRTIRDLMRLMQHKPEDILKLLRDLERAGVIQL